MGGTRWSSNLIPGRKLSPTKFGGSLCPVTIGAPREWTDCGISTTEGTRDIRRVPGLISLCLSQWESAINLN
jgi:hypothetical protein